MYDENFKRALRRTLSFEGGFTDGKNQVCDMPTNMGITQRTLDSYNAMRADKNFPTNVRNLTHAQATKIYYDMYWAGTLIPQIKHARIQDAAFDINVMSGARCMARTMQRAINTSGVACVVVDGVMGTHTIAALNNIPDGKVADFIAALQSARIASMRRMANWKTAQRGWTRRVAAY